MRPARPCRSAPSAGQGMKQAIGAAAGGCHAPRRFMLQGGPHTRLLLAALVAAVTACAEPTAPGTDEPFLPGGTILGATYGVGLPLPLSTADERRLFTRGRVAFQTVFTPATGLGPLFNGNSRAECHED